eukprot:TRINITY_DN9284_c0_g1_i1.p1 TRINITY_DN9284_c0_g1~~TRINITY_DN9284_c0_g1_i1.p1  ORF type:complete len:259 (+),score=46.70 TRINITY_DN9284_c0_g1_i1:75-779(+)
MSNASTFEMLESRKKGLELLNNGRPAEAEPFLRQAVEQTKPQKNQEGFLWERRLAECLLGQRKFLEASGVAWSAFKGFGRSGPTDPDALDCKYLYAQCLYGQKKRNEALPLATQALEGLQANLTRGPDHATTFKCKALVALILKETDVVQAREIATKGLEELEFVMQRAETLASQGGVRILPVTRLGMETAKESLKQVLDNNVSRKISMSKDPVRTISTEAPSEGDLLQEVACH